MITIPLLNRSFTVIVLLMMDTIKLEDEVVAEQDNQSDQVVH